MNTLPMISNEGACASWRGSLRRRGLTTASGTVLAVLAVLTALTACSAEGLEGEVDEPSDRAEPAEAAANACAAEPYAGMLCGRAGNSCDVRSRRIFPANRADVARAHPTIAVNMGCNPGVMYSVDEGGERDTKFVFRRSNGTWSTSSTEHDVSGDPELLFDRSNQRWQLVYEGSTDECGDGLCYAFGRADSIISQDPRTLDFRLDHHDAVPESVAGKANGQLQLGFVRSNDGERFGFAKVRPNGSTQVARRGRYDAVGVGLGEATVRPNGAPHMVWAEEYFSDGRAYNNVYWSTFGGAREPIVLKSRPTDVEPHLELDDLQIAGRSQDPVVVVTERQIESTADSNKVLKNIKMWTRPSPGQAWESTPLLDERLGRACLIAGDEPGRECSFDYRRFRVLDVVASGGGDTRVIYVVDHHQGTTETYCDEDTSVVCYYWPPPQDVFTSTLRIGWLDGGGRWRSKAIASGGTPEAGAATVDNNGTIHLVVSDGRYFEID